MHASCATQDLQTYQITNGYKVWLDVDLKVIKNIWFDDDIGLTEANQQG